MPVVASRTNGKSKAILPERKLFRVRVDHCHLSAGDHVVARTTVGQDFATGEWVEAGCNGVVEAVRWSDDDQALCVWVQVWGE